MPKKLFMGFGYNCDLEYRGERLDMLDFFSWMKRLSAFDWTLWDASGYYLINKVSKKKAATLYENISGEKVLEILLEEFDRPKRAEIRRCCDLRKMYLGRLNEISGVDAEYVDSIEVMRSDRRYTAALDEALGYFFRVRCDKPELVRRIIPANSGAASELYIPLEIAEALFLREIRGIEGKFGPNSEEYFDELILAMADEKGLPYTAIRCPLGPRKAGYLSDKEVMTTKGLVEFQDEEYKKYVQGYLSAFIRKDESLLECATRIITEVER